ncbi:MAG: diaminopimelate epimerase, partial [Rhizobiales bacterium]|nr:diaminopimelate epimerase [Hyphomicrobiales bacterium]
GKTGRVVDVRLPGGVLNIEWRADNHILMTGAAEFEHEGVIALGQGNLGDEIRIDVAPDTVARRA